jgi:hypothetical protein
MNKLLKPLTKDTLIEAKTKYNFFETPIHHGKYIYELHNPKNKLKIIDICCGMGSLVDPWYKNDHDSEEFRKKFSVFRMEYKNKSNRGDLIETNLEIFKNIVDSYYLGEIPETSQIAKKTVFLIKLHEENMRINKVPNVEVNKEIYHLIENSTSYVFYYRL